MIPIVDVDRAVMGFSLAVHIILASLGMAFPVIILSLEYVGIRKNDPDYGVLARKLSIIFVILFAVGTASGILVAVELFLLWPTFMALVGQVAILPVVVEVFAFFAETVFIAIYLYSWDKFKWKYAHLLTGIPIAAGAAASAILIIMLNAFMNTPVGFNIPQYLLNGTVTGVNPFAVFTSPSSFTEVIHGAFASYFAGAMLVAGYFAYRLIKERDEQKLASYRKCIKVILAISIVALVITIITGVMSIDFLAHAQPEKYAAIEANFNATADAPIIIGGIPINNNTGIADYILIPGLQSDFLGNISSVAPGLNSYPRDTWPPLIVHIMFDIMFFIGVGIGLLFALIALIQAVKRNALRSKFVMIIIILCTLGGALVLEIGWVMSEFARQPWIIYNVMTVQQAANYSPSLLPAALAIFAFYLAVIPVTMVVLRKVMNNNPL